MFKKYIILLLMILFINKSSGYAKGAADPVYVLMPWQVGQFVEYGIESFEQESTKNRYRITIVDSESIDGKVYYWQQIDLYENMRYVSGDQLKKNISFLALVEPFNEENFKCEPAKWIANGLFPLEARRLKVQIFDQPFQEVNPRTFFSHQKALENSLYVLTPDYQGNIDFSKLGIDNRVSDITVTAGIFNCSHFFVRTIESDSYKDEGFDLWRSPVIPFGGIVKMTFSDTKYWEKWSYRNESGKIRGIKELWQQLFKRRVSGRRRPDTYSITLINYGMRDASKK